MEKSNKIGLDLNKSLELCNELDILLSSYSVFYQNLRGFHWNIKGKDFYVLHEKFEEIYNAVSSVVDEIAERILTMGGHPAHSFNTYLSKSTLKAVENISSAEDCISNILMSYEILLKQERNILSKASLMEDEGTVSLMSEYIQHKEKQIWMLSAFLK